MATPTGTHFVLSASLIGSGAPTYQAKSGNWSPNLQEAHPASTEAEANEMLAAAAKEESLVCDPYTFPVALNGQEIDPLTAREQIRAKGPTVPYRRPDPVAGASAVPTTGASAVPTTGASADPATGASR